MSVLIGLLIGLPPPQVREEPIPQTPEERYEALMEQYDAPLGVYLNDLPRAEAATEPFLTLAREAPADPIALDALGWVVTHTLFTPMAGEAMDLLARDHLQSERLGAILRDLDRLYGGPFEPLEQLLRRAIAGSPHREVRARACLTLARDLTARKEEAERHAVLHPTSTKRDDVPFFPEPTSTATDLEQCEAEAAALYERVVSEFGDFAELAESAEGDLFELRNLGVGDDAPEIEGEDVDRKQFRLSDYRGKVVILDFWNHAGCGACRAMYPHLRSLAEGHEGERLAILGINSDDEREVLRELRDRGEITWRFWCDGDSGTGPIARRWNVSGWPTIYILDHRGVIRYKNLRITGATEEAVNTLLKEMEATAAGP